MPYRDILLTLICAGLLPVAVARPWIGVLAWFWIGFHNPHRLTWGFATTLPFAQMFAIATLLGLLLSKEPKKGIRWNFELVMMLVLFADFTVTTVFAWYPSVAWEEWEKFGKILLMLYVMQLVIYGKERIWWALMVIALSIGYYGVKGALFTISTGGVFSVMGPGNSFIGPNTGIGLALVMISPLLIALAREEPRRWLKNGLRFTGLCSMFSVPFTYSRGALLGLASIAPFILLRSKRKFLLLIILVPVAYFAKDLIPQELYSRTQSIGEYQTDQSAQLRLQAWSVARNIAKENPLTGAGFNFEYGRNDERWLSYADFIVPEIDNYARAAHSIYFQVLGQHGYVGLALFLFLFLLTPWRLRRIQNQARKNPETRWIAAYAGAFQLGLIGFYVAGAFVSLAYFDLVYTYLAFIAVLQRELAAQRAAERATDQPATRAIVPRPSPVGVTPYAKSPLRVD